MVNLILGVCIVAILTLMQGWLPHNILWAWKLHKLLLLEIILASNKPLVKVADLIVDCLQITLLGLWFFEFALELWPILQQLRHGG